MKTLKRKKGKGTYIKLLFIALIIPLFLLPIYKIAIHFCYQKYGQSTPATVLAIEKIGTLNTGMSYVHYDGVKIEYQYLVAGTNFTQRVEKSFLELEELGYFFLKKNSSLRIEFLEFHPSSSRIIKATSKRMNQ